jgi:hypothetical protein
MTQKIFRENNILHHHFEKTQQIYNTLHVEKKGI